LRTHHTKRIAYPIARRAHSSRSRDLFELLGSDKKLGFVFVFIDGIRIVERNEPLAVSVTSYSRDVTLARSAGDALPLLDRLSEL
jgi:hypothetical protein